MAVSVYLHAAKVGKGRGKSEKCVDQDETIAASLLDVSFSGTVLLMFEIEKQE